MNRVLEHNPADMTVTVETGLTLAALQERLAQRGQWLPIDPPNPETATIADILNSNASGPHRFGYGTIREHLLGLTVALADGRLIHSGGKVVKNVAGYDLCKLFVGSRGSLGVLVEATFKLRPLPESQQIVGARCESLCQAAAMIEAIHDSELTPVVLDLHNLTSATRSRAREEAEAVASAPIRLLTPAATSPSDCWIVLNFAGTREEVDWQLTKAAELGLNSTSDVQYKSTFWSTAEVAPPHRISTLPSRLTEAIQGLGEVQFVARAGNGVVYYRGGKASPHLEMPETLMQRIKQTYDPKRLLPDWSAPAT